MARLIRHAKVKAPADPASRSSLDFVIGIERTIELMIADLMVIRRHARSLRRQLVSGAPTDRPQDDDLER